ncbi:MAG: hypothetical protein Q9183_004285, partial [Haloplaca sp. 2 TL-2023]
MKPKAESQPKNPKFLDPLSPDFLKRKPDNVPEEPREAPQQGDLTPSSIFDEGEGQDTSAPDRPKAARTSRRNPTTRDPAVLAAALDPNPRARQQWERKMIIRNIKNRGQLTKAQRIARTERESLCKSQFIFTSIKKLMPLARQIAGKPIEEAIIQMRFSKKKAARDVKKHLEYARDEAIVKRGMGLGMVQPEVEQARDAKDMPASAKQSNGRLPPALEEGATQEATPEAEGPQGVQLLSTAKAEDPPQGAEQSTPSPQQRPGIVVEDKKGKRRLVTDTSSIYVDEAWVGRGSYSVLEYDFRARGRLHKLKSPETSITVRLKEEATRIRLMDEREQKRRNKKVWLPMPDRPVTAQR